MNRQFAEMILDKPGWGPGNESLVDAILAINPSVQERLNPFIAVSGFARFVTIAMEILNETGGLDKVSEALNLRPEVKERLKECIAMFSYAFGTEASAKSWGLPLEKKFLVFDSSDEYEYPKVKDSVDIVETTTDEDVVKTFEMAEEEEEDKEEPVIIGVEPPSEG
jgi:hypothetical protein